MNSALSGCDFAAGWFSGVCGLVIGHPLDTVKVWKQTIPEKTSTSNVVITLFKHESIKGFYKGMMFPLLSAGALNAVFFGVYGNTLRLLQEVRGVDHTMGWKEELPYKEWHWDVFYSGCVGGLVSLIINCPVELVKTQMQTQTRQPNLVAKRVHQYKGPWDCLIDQYKSNGIKGCYRGIVPLLWRDVPTYGLYILTYETFLYQERKTKDSEPKIMHQIIGGALAGIALSLCLVCPGMVSWATVVPLDVVKSRVQADSKTHPKYKGMFDCAVQSYRQDGIRVFFRGFWVILMRSVPVNAVTFVTYEQFLTFCNR